MAVRQRPHIDQVDSRCGRRTSQIALSRVTPRFEVPTYTSRGERNLGPQSWTLLGGDPKAFGINPRRPRD
jgi:hypothetical protein